VHLLRRAGESDSQALVGWEVEYDPEYDLLNLIDPGEAADENGDDADGAEDTDDGGAG